MSKFLKLLIFMAFFTISSAYSAQNLQAVKSKWVLEKIWKDARAGKSHFYKGKFALKNTSDKPLTQVKVKISLIAPGGETIDTSKTLNYGTLAPGQTKTIKFEIDKGVQFAQIFVDAKFTKEDKKLEASFMARGGACPQSDDSFMGGADFGLRTIAVDISEDVRPGRKNKQRKYEFTVRLKNIGVVDAIDPTAEIIFKVSGSKNIKKYGKEHKVTVVLKKGKILGGQDETFRKKLMGIPEHESRSINISAQWPDANEDVVVESGGAMKFIVDAGEVSVSRFAATPGKSVAVEFDVTNKSKDIEAGKLTIEITLTDDKNKVLKTIKYFLMDELKKGQTKTIKLEKQNVPAYTSIVTGINY